MRVNDLAAPPEPTHPLMCAKVRGGWKISGCMAVPNHSLKCLFCKFLGGNDILYITIS